MALLDDVTELIEEFIASKKFLAVLNFKGSDSSNANGIIFTQIPYGYPIGIRLIVKSAA